MLRRQKCYTLNQPHEQPPFVSGVPLIPRPERFAYQYQISLTYDPFLEFFSKSFKPKRPFVPASPATLAVSLDVSAATPKQIITLDLRLRVSRSPVSVSPRH